MENSFKVGDKYKWPSEPYDVAEIISIQGDTFTYKCDSDGYTSTALLLEAEDWKEWVKVDEESPITPSHYNSTKITALQVIDDWKLDFYLGNTIKYIQRHEKKNNALEDLKKAASYLQLKIEKMEYGEGKD